jgi:hypothetical protein
MLLSCHDQGGHQFLADLFKALGSFLAREFLVAKWNPSSLTARLID